MCGAPPKRILNAHPSDQRPQRKAEREQLNMRFAAGLPDGRRSYPNHHPFVVLRALTFSLGGRGSSANKEAKPNLLSGDKERWLKIAEQWLQMAQEANARVATDIRRAANAGTKTRWQAVALAPTRPGRKARRRDVRAGLLTRRGIKTMR